MIVDMPFAYLAQVLLRGKQTPTIVKVLDRVSVEIPEYSSHDAPVIAEIIDCECRPRGQYRLSPGNCFMKPVRTSMGDSDGAEGRLAPPELSNRLLEVYKEMIAGTRHRTPFRLGGSRVSGGMPRHAIDAEKWIKDNRDVTANKVIHSFLEGSGIVDGLVYFPSFGPRFVVDYTTLERRIAPDRPWNDEPPKDWKNSTLPVEFAPNLDRKSNDFLSTCAATMARSHRGQAPVWHVIGRIEWHGRCAPGWVGDDVAIATLVQNTVYNKTKGMGVGSLLMHFDGAGIKAFANLKDAIESDMDRQVVEESFEELRMSLKPIWQRAEEKRRPIPLDGVQAWCCFREVLPFVPVQAHAPEFAACMRP